MTGDFSSEEARRLWLALPTADVEAVLSRALAEDTGWGDITTATTVEPDWPGQARIVARQEGVLAGAWVAEAVFDLVDAGLTVALLAADGELVFDDDIDALFKSLSHPGQRLAAHTRQRIHFAQCIGGDAMLIRHGVARHFFGFLMKQESGWPPEVRYPWWRHMTLSPNVPLNNLER